MYVISLKQLRTLDESLDLSWIWHKLDSKLTLSYKHQSQIESPTLKLYNIYINIHNKAMHIF